jgi:arsenite methyltransferase
MGDRWAEWLLEHRFGGDSALRESGLRRLMEYRQRVLAGAGIVPGDVVLDVGSGDGLVALGALELVGPSGAVIFSDVSAELLELCRSRVRDDRCRFVHAGLPDLVGIATESVDVVTTRSVLIYVPDKRAAFATLFRVLRPGGRLSIFEPINSFGKPEPESSLWGFDVTGLEALASRVKAAYSAHKPAADPMLDFDERDLLDHAVAAGFRDLHLSYEADIGTDPSPVDWAVFLRTAANPLVPTFGDILSSALDADERSALVDRMKQQVTPRQRRHATAYLTARR